MAVEFPDYYTTLGVPRDAAGVTEHELMMAATGAEGPSVVA